MQGSVGFYEREHSHICLLFVFGVDLGHKPAEVTIR